jgi:hypothetical protein
MGRQTSERHLPSKKQTTCGGFLLVPGGGASRQSALWCRRVSGGKLFFRAKSMTPRVAMTNREQVCRLLTVMTVLREPKNITLLHHTPRNFDKHQFRFGLVRTAHALWPASTTHHAIDFAPLFISSLHFRCSRSHGCSMRAQIRK